MKLCIFLMIASVSIWAAASGTITLDGNFFGKTDKTFMIQMGGQIYSLSKASLLKNQRDYLEALKWQQKATVTVAMDSVTEVHDKK
jgi:hypothetical protein